MQRGDYMTLDRRDYKSAIPQLEKKIDNISTEQTDIGLDYSAFKEKTKHDLIVIDREIDDSIGEVNDNISNVSDLLHTKVSAGGSNITNISDVMELSNDGLHTKQTQTISGETHTFDAHLTSNALAFEQDGNEIARAGADKFSAQELVVKSNVSGQMGESLLTIGKFRIGTHAVGLGTNLRIYYVGDE